MTAANCTTLAELITSQKESILDEWRHRVQPLLSARALDTPVLTDDIPNFLDKLAECVLDNDSTDSWVEVASADSKINDPAASHGQQRFHVGFDLVEVIKEYGILREVIYECAERAGLIIVGREGHTLNLTFNRAVSKAVEAYQHEKDLEQQKRRRDYLAFIMHDLKTPLNAISVAANVIEDSVSDPKMVAEMARIIVRGVAQLDEQLQKTIVLSKNTAAEVTEEIVSRRFELWPIVQSSIDEFRLLAAESQTIIHNLVPANLFVYADAVAMKTVLRNLLSNAIKYSPGGLVVLGVTTSRKEVIELWIRDNGNGIPPERLRSIFQKVEPDPEQKGSTGLGLFMVKKLVDAQGGKVSVESKPGDGATFRMMLPINAPAS